MKESLSNPSNPALSTWGLATPLCQWDGVIWSHESNAQFDCTTELWSGSFTYATDLGAVVTSLILQSANLHGTLSPTIANLNELTILILNNNSLKGSIPRELGNSPSLGVISLSHNHITGPIPASIWNLCRTSSKFTTLILEFNNISGHIPDPLGGKGMTCLDLTSLDVSHNFLSGCVPAFIANFASLSHLDLSNNLFTYIIPLEFAELTNLSTGPDGFSVANNHFMGPIPPFHKWFDESAFVGNSPLLCGLPLQPCVVDPGAHHPPRRKGLSPTGIYVLMAARVYLLSGEGKLVDEEVDGGSKGKLVRFEGCGEDFTEEAVLNASTAVRGEEDTALLASPIYPFILRNSKQGRMSHQKMNNYIQELVASDTRTLIGRVLNRCSSGDPVPREEVVSHSSPNLRKEDYCSHRKLINHILELPVPDTRPLDRESTQQVLQFLGRKL